MDQDYTFDGIVYTFELEMPPECLYREAISLIHT